MPFSYYKRLSKRQKAIYRKSDEIRDVPLERRAELREATDAIRVALEADDRVTVEKTARRLVGKILMQLEVEPVTVRVLATRPRDAASELHGLYTREEGKRPVIQVWMRTAVHKRPVRFRTFLRTLMHEVLHHLDFACFGLADSFHTEGFYARESSLIRQIAPSRKKRGKPGIEAAAEREPARPRPKPRPKRRRPGRGSEPQSPDRKGERPVAEQMELPLFG